jgi:hypothetical protein
MNTITDTPARVRSNTRRTTRAPQDDAVTLFDLVEAVAGVTDDEDLVVATIVHMLRSGRVTLRRSLRELSPEWRAAEVR